MWKIPFIRAGIVSIVATVVLAVITFAIIETSAFGDSADPHATATRRTMM